MAFWGVEVKPGKPFTHSGGRRLHISQATLGLGSSVKKSIVQCNMTNRAPVFLCSLFPEMLESCQLHLEFNEADKVVFSVIGPRSVHLTGYYLRGGLQDNQQDESESYGEDIADTETDRSVDSSDEDEYDDSFIDDRDLEFIPPSPVSSGGVEEMVNRGKSRSRKGNRGRLRKKYQLSESDDDNVLHQRTCTNGKTVVAVLDSDSDLFPISSLCTSKPSTKRRLEVDEKAKKDTVVAGKETKNDGKGVNVSKRKMHAVVDGEAKRQPKNCNSVVPSAELGPEIGAKSNKERKQQYKDNKQLEFACADDFFFSNALKWNKTKQSESGSENLSQDLPALSVVHKTAYDNVVREGKPQQDETKIANVGQDVPLRNEENQMQANECKRTDYLANSMSLSAHLGPGNCAKPKRKWKKLAEDKTLEDSSGSHSHDIQEDRLKLSESMEIDQLVHDQKNQNQATYATVDNSTDQSAIEHCSAGKKKKKKTKTEKNDFSKVEACIASKDGKNNSVTGTKDNGANEITPQLRTLSNGLVIEQLENGKPDGKIAAPGKKISIRYTGKLKDSGQVFDSNTDGARYKFCLGGENVLEWWNVGLDGMRVGDKRKIVVPPSMGFGTEGDGKSIPPNAWLEYDVELLKVR